MQQNMQDLTAHTKSTSKINF